MKKFSTLIHISLLSLCLPGAAAAQCAKPIEQSSTSSVRAPATQVVSISSVVKSGSVEGSTYTNSYLGLTLAIPDGWEVQGEAVKQKIIEKGKELITSSDSKTQADIDESVSNTGILLTLFETPASPLYRSSLLIAAERISGTGISSLNYATNVKTGLLEHPQAGYVVEKDIRIENINGIPFAIADFNVNNPEGQAHQRYLFHIKDGYALGVILSYASDTQLSALNKVVAGLSLNRD
jgi:hypothetical protein